MLTLQQSTQHPVWLSWYLVGTFKQKIILICEQEYLTDIMQRETQWGENSLFMLMQNCCSDRVRKMLNARRKILRTWSGVLSPHKASCMWEPRGEEMALTCLQICIPDRNLYESGCTRKWQKYSEVSMWLTAWSWWARVMSSLYFLSLKLTKDKSTVAN